MTEITYAQEGDKYFLECDGHSIPIVCSAVSAISYMMEGWIINNPDKIQLIENSLKSGFFRLFFISSDKGAEAVFEAAVIGLLQIAESYSGYAHMEITEKMPSQEALNPALRRKIHEEIQNNGSKPEAF